MSHLLDDDDVDDLQGRSHHRELTLSTGTVLGIFLGLALSWALFFGFGYNMGNKARQAATPVAAETPEAGASTGTNFNSFKPAAGSPVAQSGVAPPSTDSGPVVSVPPGSPARADTPADTTATAEKPTPISLHPAPAAVTPVANPAPSATGTFVVQVAAVSHQEDATLLVNALHAKGYSVSAHPAGDNLIHIQVGPFGTRKEADSMRQQLLSDGYNAIVK